MSAGDERALVRSLARSLGSPGPRPTIGIGDDGAVLRRPRTALVATVDAAVEGTHFRREWLSLRDLGRRSFHAAASDLAAMGGRPLGALSALVLTGPDPGATARAIAAGQAAAARELGCPVVGGNVARGRELSVTTTVLGEARRPLLRSGARAGDELWLVGQVGLAAAGLALLLRGRPPVDRAERECLRAWRSPSALVTRGLALAGRAGACIDLSDGLALDATRMAEASGVRLVIEAGALVGALSPSLQLVARRLGASSLDWALGGGEDYALLAAGPRARRPRWAVRIGQVERGRGVRLRARDGRLRPVAPSGFDHLARRDP